MVTSEEQPPRVVGSTSEEQQLEAPDADGPQQAGTRDKSPGVGVGDSIDKDDDEAARQFPWYRAEYIQDVITLHTGPAKAAKLVSERVKKEYVTLLRHCVNVPQSFDLVPCREGCAMCVGRPKLLPEIWGYRIPLPVLRYSEDAREGQRLKINDFALYRSDTADPPIARTRDRSASKKPAETRYLSYEEATERATQGGDLRMAIPSTKGADECEVRETACDKCSTFFRYRSEKTRHEKWCDGRPKKSRGVRSGKKRELSLGSVPGEDDMREVAPNGRRTRERKKEKGRAEASGEDLQPGGSQLVLYETHPAHGLMPLEDAR